MNINECSMLKDARGKRSSVGYAPGISVTANMSYMRDANVFDLFYSRAQPLDSGQTRGSRLLSQIHSSNSSQNLGKRESTLPTIGPKTILHSKTHCNCICKMHACHVIM